MKEKPILSYMIQYILNRCIIIILNNQKLTCDSNSSFFKYVFANDIFIQRIVFMDIRDFMIKIQILAFIGTHM